MIKKEMSGREQYECSKCGEETTDDAEYCQICGHHFESVEDELEFDYEEIDNENETFCVLTTVRTFDFFSITQLKKDTTPRMLLNHPNFQNVRMMEEPNRNEFYIFKTDYYSHLHSGMQINIDFEYYESIKTLQGLRLVFDKRHFTELELNELNNYNLQ